MYKLDLRLRKMKKKDFISSENEVKTFFQSVYRFAQTTKKMLLASAAGCTLEMKSSITMACVKLTVVHKADSAQAKLDIDE